MSDPQHEIRLWMQAELTKRGHGAKGALATFLGVRPDAITRMANLDPAKETREIRAHEHAKMQEFFERDSHGGFGEEAERFQVPLIGYVGAGAAAHFYGEGQGPFEYVSAPDGATPHTVAVEVQGVSLGALFDHWLVYYDEVRTPVTPDMVGKVCVVGLIDERVLVKQIARSKTPGVYHLLSNTEGPILDVEIIWAAKVKSMVPR